MNAVFNLATGKYQAIYTLNPREAVIAAYAQCTMKDWNTWEYETKYGAMVIEGKHTAACGDFCAHYGRLSWKVLEDARNQFLFEAKQGY